MKITKFVHSCILAEEDGEVVLFDPGEFSWNSGLFKIDDLEKLDAIVITHEHPDHFHEPFVKALAEKFPKACIISTETVVNRLKEIGINNSYCESTKSIHVFSTKPHASLEPLGKTPENIAVHFADKLTVGGDRHDLEETKAILALPITAPWGRVRDGAEMVLRLKPKYVLPIHDWHWNEDARKGEYKRSGGVYADHDIQFLVPIDGEPLEVKV